MAGGSEALEKAVGLFEGLEALRSEMSQLYSDLKNRNLQVQDGGQQEILNS